MRKMTTEAGGWGGGGGGLNEGWDDTRTPSVGTPPESREVSAEGRRRHGDHGPSTHAWRGWGAPARFAAALRRGRPESPMSERAMDLLRQSSLRLSVEVLDALERGPGEKQLVTQAKALCRDYINWRLLRAGLGWGKAESSAHSCSKFTEVSNTVLLLGDELEYMYPSLYRNVDKHLGLSVASEAAVTEALQAVAHVLFGTGITWAKVVSLLAVSAGLAVDCVTQGQPATVHALVDCVGDVFSATLVPWIRARGGWADMVNTMTCRRSSPAYYWLLATVGAAVGILGPLLVPRRTGK
ncbi:LOW QUALITY PROTEIN: bcl-2-related ovarian killer protein [Lampetra planeri]